MRVTPVAPVYYPSNKPRQSRAFLRIDFNDFTVIDTVTNERFVLSPEAAHRKIAEINSKKEPEMPAKHEYSPIQILLIWLAAVALCAFFWGYVITLASEAMHEETVNQRMIAAGQWKHQPGYMDYQQFTENN